MSTGSFRRLQTASRHIEDLGRHVGAQSRESPSGFRQVSAAGVGLVHRNLRFKKGMRDRSRTRFAIVE
jgi:hypothetical protein